LDLSSEEEETVLEEAVDLILEAGKILIRPDPSRMDLAFEADALLQEIAPVRCIRFQDVRDPRVRDAIRQRGEAWRIHPLPQSKDQIKALIHTAQTAVAGQAIYYYNAAQGSRLLTCERFCRLGQLDDDDLRQHLVEISDLSGRVNVRGYPELDLFMASSGFSRAELAGIDWSILPMSVVRERFAELARRFQEAAGPLYQHDDPAEESWRNRLYAALIGRRDDELSESDLLGLGAEFFMQIQWLPGARIEGGELIFDPLAGEPVDARDPNSGNPVVLGLICNLAQQYDMAFINIGQVMNTLCRREPSAGRREVYVAHFRQRGNDRDTLLIIRMQKYGVSEHLDDGKDLLRAMIECESYTEYILDRRLGCRQLGMNLPPRISMRKVTERYRGSQRTLAGTTIWSPYFERDYVAGVASDKIPTIKLKDPRYATALAMLLGRAAAPNLIVGRSDSFGRVIFDDGDEVVVEDAKGLPTEIIVSDHTGTFGNFASDLRQLAPAYAGPVLRRWHLLTDPAAFAQTYVEGFRIRFAQLQIEYRDRRRAFNGLFKHRAVDPAGNLAYRWLRVLQRLDEAQPDVLAEAIRAHICPPPAATD